jgi:PAS domain S-box-containing protein
MEADWLDCGGNCLFYRFFKTSREAMFLTSRDGVFIDLNPAMENLLGYAEGELRGQPVTRIYDSGGDRKIYQRVLEKTGVVHNFPLPLKDRRGKVIFSLVDAIVWNENGDIKGYYGIIKTNEEVVESFRDWFNRLKEEKELVREERRNLVSDARLLVQYMSDDLIRYVQQTGKNPLESARREATVLFFDIRNSTAISESIEPEDFAQFLSDLFTDIMDLVYGNGGSVNKLLGDGLMATFGCPLSTGNDGLSAAVTALQIRDYLKTFNDVRPPFLKDPVKAGMGIATGTLFSGVIGSVRRQEYTVLGDPVNLASRLEELTKKTGEEILIDGATYRKIQERILCRMVCQTPVRGRSGQITVYGL